MPKQNKTTRNSLQMFEVLPKDIFTCCAYCSGRSLLNVLCTINTNVQAVKEIVYHRFWRPTAKICTLPLPLPNCIHCAQVSELLCSIQFPQLYNADNGTYLTGLLLLD